MWTCQKCGRIFKKANQPHSCQKVPLERHFNNKKEAKEIFDHLVEKIRKDIGECRIISIPCCVHLFGRYDFLAALPKKDRLEVRFALGRALDSQRIRQTVPMSAKVYKNCLDLVSKSEIDHQLINWLEESYFLKD